MFARMRLGLRLAAHWQEPQYRNAWWLMLNNVLGAVSGLAFWVLVARFLGLSPAEVGAGVAIVSLGTAAGLVAKGGFDTALVRHVPGLAREEGVRLLGISSAVGALVALALAGACFAAAAPLGLEGLPPEAFLLTGAIGALLCVTWMQDAHFLAEGDARWSFRRNTVLHAGRLVAPVPIVALALPAPIPVAWALAIAASALVAFAFLRRLPSRPKGATRADRRAFFRSAGRNTPGGFAEFLPGFLLPPLVLATEGPEAAAYFGIAWTAAAGLFLLSSAIGRSAMAEITRSGQAPAAPLLRKAARHHLLVVAPAAVGGLILAPWVLLPFGDDYAHHGGPVLALLSASALFVAPTYLYLALLRARERTVPLLAFPAVMIVALLALAPPLAAEHGIEGVAIAWVLANVPVGAFAAWRLRQETKEVILDVELPANLGRPAHVE
ncbi:MAG TPA: hypothetical protein VM681_10325 [Candidatus Thermoplasmatota archaeon]|nr:hypothetical protein [Candidatus Thermoplasmatota archaeon]